MLNIKVDAKALLQNFNTMSKAIDKARVSANNKTARQGLTQAKKIIRQEYNIQAKYLNRNIKTQRGNTLRPAAQIIASGSGISLKAYSPRQVKTGVSISVKKGNRKIIKHAFGPKIGTLGGSVFQRVGKERLPIRKLLGPGAAALMDSKKVMKTLDVYLAENYKRIYESELKYYSGKIIK